MAGQGGARELRIAGNEPAGTFCDFHTSSLGCRIEDHLGRAGGCARPGFPPLGGIHFI